MASDMWRTKKCHHCGDTHARRSIKSDRLMAYCGAACESDARRERMRRKLESDRRLGPARRLTRSAKEAARREEEMALRAARRARGHSAPCARCGGLPHRRPPNGAPCTTCGGTHEPDVIERTEALTCSPIALAV